MHGVRPGLIALVVFLAVFATSYGYLQLTASQMPVPQETATQVIGPPPAAMGQGAPPPMPEPAANPPSPEPRAESASADYAPNDISPGAGIPDAGSDTPPAASADPPGADVPMAPSSSPPETMPPPPPPPPTAHIANNTYRPSIPPASDPAPAPAMPPAAAADPPAPAAMPPAAAADPPAAAAPVKNTRANKVISYFQQSKTRVDTRNAFGFVLLPKSAITAEEKHIQKQFCEIMLSSMDFMAPAAAGAAAARGEVMATYWPIVATHESFEIKAAFEGRHCDKLLAWYDHKLARALAAKAGVAELSGPLLITWPSAGEEYRNPLIVDFAKADYEHATKALQYWFVQLRHKPELWTDRIREGTIRAELADAVNDTAGVVLSVLYGKWESLTVVSASATP